MRLNAIPDTPVNLQPLIDKYFAHVPTNVTRIATPEGDKSFFQRVNDAAMAELDAWVPQLFDSAERARGGYRVRSVDLGRDLEEDLSIQPEGIVDFGIHDLGDEREGKRTPLELVIEHRDRIDLEGGVVPAAKWLCLQLIIDPSELGWKDSLVVPLSADEFEPLETDADEIPGFERNRSGKILATIENVCAAIAQGGFTGWQVGFDEFRDAVMVAPLDTNDWRYLSDADYTEMRIRLERRDFKPVSKDLVRDAVEYVADKHRFDSAVTWLRNLAWDGKPRISKFLHTYFGAPDTEYARAVSTYMWTALAGRVVSPGIKADMMPILVGDQGAGKSTGVAAMVPSPDFFFEADLSAKEDDLARRMRGQLIAEVGELRGLHSREIEHIKAYISRTHEKWIPKFKEFATLFPRRCLFIGTTNKMEFLADETGERRFLPVVVGQVDRDAIIRDRLQLWAEAREVFAQSGIQWTVAETLARDVHEQHKLIDPWSEIVETWLTAPMEFDMVDAKEGLPRGMKPFTIAEMLQSALGFDARNITNQHDKRAGAILRKLGYIRKNARINGKVMKAWVAGMLE